MQTLQSEQRLRSLHTTALVPGFMPCVVDLGTVDATRLNLLPKIQRRFQERWGGQNPLYPRTGALAAPDPGSGGHPSDDRLPL